MIRSFSTTRSPAFPPPIRKQLAVSQALFERQWPIFTGTVTGACGSTRSSGRSKRACRSEKRSCSLDDGFRICIQPCGRSCRFGFTATVFFVAGCAGRESNWKGKRLPGGSFSVVRGAQLSRAGFTFGSHTLTHSF